MAHVLIVDDDDEIRVTLRMLLEDAGHTVQDVNGAEMCLNLLRAASERMVVLLDLIMPVVSGLQVLEAAHAETAALGRHVFILMTADTRLLLAQATPLLAALSVRLVRKPFDVDTLLEAVERAAERLT